MYFSYSPSPSSTSYSASPMDMPSSSSCSQPQSPSCAYPSWPQGPSLSTGRSGSQSTSFIISDEELFSTVFSDSDTDCSPPTTPNSSRSPTSPSMLWEPRAVVDHGAQMRDLIAQEKVKKEKRRRQKSVCKKSKSSSDKHMSPILE